MNKKLTLLQVARLTMLEAKICIAQESKTSKQVVTYNLEPEVISELEKRGYHVQVRKNNEFVITW